MVHFVISIDATTTKRSSRESRGEIFGASYSGLYCRILFITGKDRIFNSSVTHSKIWPQKAMLTVMVVRVALYNLAKLLYL